MTKIRFIVRNKRKIVLCILAMITLAVLFAVKYKNMYSAVWDGQVSKAESEEAYGDFTDIQEHMSSGSENISVYDENRRKVILEEVAYIDVMSRSSYTDVRIRFPNGEDFIVLENICVTEEAENIYTAMLEEEEILMYSSALSDLLVYKECILYATGGSRRLNSEQAVYVPNVNILSIPEFKEICGKDDEGLKGMKETRNAFEKRIALFYKTGVE